LANSTFGGVWFQDLRSWIPHRCRFKRYSKLSGPNQPTLAHERAGARGWRCRPSCSHAHADRAARLRMQASMRVASVGDSQCWGWGGRM